MNSFMMRFTGCITWMFQLECAAFKNVDFDSVDASHVERVPGTSIDDFSRQGQASDLIPGWSLYYDGQTYNGVVYYLNAFVGSPSIVFVPPTVGFAHQHYFEFASDSLSITHKFSLQQSGMIPLNAWELRTFGHAFVYLNGVELSYRVLPGFNQGAFDVHEFAGQEATLEIRNYDNSGNVGGIRIDIFGFTTPEPSEWALFIVGGGILWFAVKGRGGRRRSGT